jgi:hypothetical protein
MAAAAPWQVAVHCEIVTLSNGSAVHSTDFYFV